MDKTDINNCAYFFSNGQINIDKKQVKIERKDFRFYKKRIFNLYKQLMTKKETDPVLLEAFNEFNKKAIEHLKFIDKSSILQEEYVDLSDNISGKHCFNTSVNKPLDKVQYSNHMLMKDYNLATKSVTEGLGVIKKKLKETKPIVLPEKKNINLKDTKFKHKDLEKSKGKGKGKKIL